MPTNVSVSANDYKYVYGQLYNQFNKFHTN